MNQLANRMTDLFSRVPTAGISTGQALYLERGDRKAFGGGNTKVANFGREAAASIKEYLDARKSTVHPEEVRRLSIVGVESLTPSDMLWLQRLPQDPAKVPFDDAVRLSQLARTITATANPSDHNLLQSIWAPVKEQYDRRRAEAQLYNADLRLPSLPNEAHAALGELIQAESDQLTPVEAFNRANSMFADALAARDREAERMKAEAQAFLSRIDEAAARRGAITVD